MGISIPRPRQRVSPRHHKSEPSVLVILLAGGIALVAGAGGYIVANDPSTPTVLHQVVRVVLPFDSP